jgi:uncharacterized protein (DUF885 family)
MGIGAALLMIATAGTVVAAEGEDGKLAEHYRRYMEEVFRTQPMTATRWGDHRFDDRLDDLSPETRAANVERDRRWLKELPGLVDPKALSPDGRIDLAIWKSSLERDVWLAENFSPYAEDPRLYVGLMTESIYLPLSQSTVPKEEALRAILVRMDQVPKVVEQAKAALKNPPKVFAEIGLSQAQGAVGFFEEELFLLAGLPKGEGELGKKAKICADAVRDYAKFLESEVLPRANGEWRIGAERFRKKLDYELDAGIGADEVYQLAKGEADEVIHEMFVVARQLWSRCYPGRTIPPDDPEGRVETIRLVLEATSKEHGTPEALVEDAKATVDAIREFIREGKILALPEPDRCAIIEMPEFQRGNSVAYLNPAPPLDTKARSEYAISPPPASWTPRRVESFLEEYNRAMLKVLTIHEAYPGHYVQLEYSNRNPSVIRRTLYSGVFAEGWAVYTERMMLDQGFGDGDLALRLNQLKFYLRAIVNSILDHEMHCKGMTDEQAMDLLMNRAFQSEGEAAGKVIRAKLSSCQLSTYYVGRTAFQRLRRQVQREQGDRFDLKSFHEEALSHGTIPVKFLPELVRKGLKTE